MRPNIRKVVRIIEEDLSLSPRASQLSCCKSSSRLVTRRLAVRCWSQGEESKAKKREKNRFRNLFRHCIQLCLAMNIFFFLLSPSLPPFLSSFLPSLHWGITDKFIIQFVKFYLCIYLRIHNNNKRVNISVIPKFPKSLFNPLLYPSPSPLFIARQLLVYSILLN